MPDNQHDHRQNYPQVVYEVVAFRYGSADDTTIVGEAEIVIETYGADTSSSTNLHSVRVDILSAYDFEHNDIYYRVIRTPGLKKVLEQAALLYYFHPPEEPVVLPRKISEW
ncbi:MAG: hypothetical protein IPK76_22260 [Lewinellaceae bacterium]|nr:hypothetical protein [Lewinellaceae bacterium]